MADFAAKATMLLLGRIHHAEVFEGNLLRPAMKKRTLGLKIPISEKFRVFRNSTPGIFVCPTAKHFLQVCPGSVTMGFPLLSFIYSNFALFWLQFLPIRQLEWLQLPVSMYCTMLFLSQPYSVPLHIPYLSIHQVPIYSLQPLQHLVCSIAGTYAHADHFHPPVDHQMVEIDHALVLQNPNALFRHIFNKVLPLENHVVVLVPV